MSRPSLEAVLRLCETVADGLWRAYRNEDDAPGLVFANSRHGAPRVSEQEARVLLTIALEHQGFHYSIETPTVETYRQTGTYALSARADLTVHGSREGADRVVNVEFKAGRPPIEVIRKDLEKLSRERIPGVWFHTLENATPDALGTLTSRFHEAWLLLGAHTSTATHEIAVVICTLAPRILFGTSVTLGEGFDGRMTTAFDSAMSEWTIHGPDAEMWHTRRTASVHSPVARSEGGSEKWLIACSDLARGSLLHFSRRGDSYRLRRFDQDADSGKPFHAIDPATREPITSATIFLDTFEVDFVTDVTGERVPLTDTTHWAARTSHGFGTGETDWTVGSADAEPPNKHGTEA